MVGIAVAVLIAAAVAVPLITSTARKLANLNLQPVPAGGFVEPIPTTKYDGSLITVTVTTQVIDQVWQAFTLDGLSDSRSQLAELASPSVAGLMIARQVCRCGSWPSDASLREVAAPPETGYPLSFLAELDEPSDPVGAQVQLVVFSKQSAGAPWLIMDLAGYGGTNRELRQPTNFDELPSPPLYGEQPFVQLGELFASLRSSGQTKQGDPWDATDTGASTQPAAMEAQLAQTYLNDHQSGYAASSSFRVVDYSRPFPVGQVTSSIECAAIELTTVITPHTVNSVVQPANRSTFTGLAPGFYSSVTEAGIYQVCVEASAPDQVDVIGLIGDSYATGGVPG